jgi:xanthine dehydrogenase accessory factor
MLVTESGLFGTVGGGELEHSATLKSRELLASGKASLLEFALGPELNQCCGGAVTLAFEPFASADRAWVGRLAAAAASPEPVFRTLRLENTGALRRDWSRAGTARIMRLPLPPARRKSASA